MPISDVYAFSNNIIIINKDKVYKVFKRLHFPLVPAKIGQDCQNKCREV